MPKLSRILLYYDGSREARSALHRAADLALAFEAHTDILAVAPIESAIAASVGCLSDLAFIQIQDATLAVLQEALDHMTDSCISAHGHMAYGDVMRSISTHASLLNADMLVVGHRTRSRLTRWLGRGLAHSELVERCNGLAVVTIPCD
ncbi:stress-like protein [Caballeronia udeis]|uniref:Stress-like protein n=1 Tax=Caballeronia udeis TaxID=1232866 RepID=A0A158JV32_9BURK|nr:universal stress protein [Caballeronia udeis]SAL72686.1 stress-like protein [Caballeronia udeis]